MAGVAGARNTEFKRRSILPPSRLAFPQSFTSFEPVNREKTCPFLLRVFTQLGRHHSVAEFAVSGQEPANEVQIYTWKDATLRELTDLLAEVLPAAKRRDARLSFALVYPDTCGRFIGREVGRTFTYGFMRQLDDNRSLNELGFQIGDYLDVAIF